VGLKELNGKNIEFRITDIDTGEILPFGKEGKLICKGPMVTKGYYNKPEETVKTIDTHGWLHTGDLGVKMRTAIFQGPSTFIDVQ